MTLDEYKKYKKGKLTLCEIQDRHNVEREVNSWLRNPEVFKRAILNNASAVIFVHNHPSGDIMPSSDDKTTTERLCKAGEILGVQVLDHIIIGNGNYHSMKSNDEF